MVWRPQSNPNSRRRHPFASGGPRSNRPLVTGSEVEAHKVGNDLREMAAIVAMRLDRRDVLEVKRHMPAIRRAEKSGRPLRRVPKKVLEIVERLRLK